MTQPDVSSPKRLERGEPIVARVLDATIQELALSGFGGLTLERVAEQAGVNRTTIYRRWPTKSDLVRATFERMAGTIRFDWDTGTMREDMRRLIEQASRTVFAPGAFGLVRMMLEASVDPELYEHALRLQNEKRGQAFAMLDRWRSRGELRADIDKEIFLDSLMGVLFRRFAFLRQTLTPAFTEQLLDYFCDVAAPRVAARPSGKRTGSKAKRPVRARARKR